MTKAWRERVVIPTYEAGCADLNPIFLEKRVYQGSSGAVYPYPVIESISDTKTDKEYDALYLENEYIKVMVLPELGGRIQMAYDKIAGRHFVYYNHVIKPALVGLAGPWISGGIEFNWPQHHRPSTFMPVDSRIVTGADGSVSVQINEYERMTHQKGMATITLRPGHAYIEIRGTLYNPTPLPQTFLWWANPAVAVNDSYRSIFPPDINAVFDHGKRAVSSFPIATGTYYKVDYSAGVDIANYRNITVPTSYMGVNSHYDFEGGYECDRRAGMLHVADHHVSPGKKQWTWGNGDFGRAWDRNLTDCDGPYIELMAGVFTENQPDFSWLMPYEEKEFTQYFMPYREMDNVLNASRDLVMNVEDVGGDRGCLTLYATSRQTVRAIVRAGGDQLFDSEVSVSPENVLAVHFNLHGKSLSDIEVEILAAGRKTMSWRAEPDEIRPIPEAARAAMPPADIRTNEQLYLTGLHLEQYRHATFNPLDYYDEALRRDSDDIRCNNAVGRLLIRRARPELAETYLRKAVRCSTRYNPNPYDGEPLYNLGLSLLMQGKRDEAYDLFYKSTWNAAWQDAGFLQCARLSAIRGDIGSALHESGLAIRRNGRNHQARALHAALLLASGDTAAAASEADEALGVEPFNFGALYVKYLASGDESVLNEFSIMLRGEVTNYCTVAVDFIRSGMYDTALHILDHGCKAGATGPMTMYYSGWARALAGDILGARHDFNRAEAADPSYCFPNSIDAAEALRTAARINPDGAMAHYYLGCLLYDKRQYDAAIGQWEDTARLKPGFATVWRNLALAFFNKRRDEPRALEMMERAYALNTADARVLMELDQLYKRLHRPHQQRLDMLMQHPVQVAGREDLKLEVITLLNMTGRHDEAMKRLDACRFHPWEGGEGKVAAQYQASRVAIAREAISSGDYDRAISLLRECLIYPEHLGEGKLTGAQDNDFHYLMGEAYAAKGDADMARRCYVTATEGPTEPAPALYYNDAKADKIFYAGLAYRALGEEDKARGLFNRLAAYGRQHYHDQVTMDYFAVSMPDLLIWEDSLDIRNRVHCLYMLALGSAGLGDFNHARRYIDEASELDPNRQDILTFKHILENNEL